MGLVSWVKAGHRVGVLVTATGLATILLLPPTRWVVQTEAQAMIGVRAFFPDETADKGQTAERAERVLRQYPNDPALPVVCAERWADALPLPAASEHITAEEMPQMEVRGEQIDNRRLYALKQMQKSRPDNAVADAALLRKLCEHRLTLQRPEQKFLRVPNRRLNIALPLIDATNRRTDLANFDGLAAGGEKACPNNGYFPFMRAFGLLIAHRDTEARAALLRAGNCTAWDDYLPAEVESTTRFYAVLYGPLTANQKMEMLWTLSLSHLSLCRAAARTFAGLAVRDEQAGRTEDGFRLRRALTHLGGQMRANASSLVVSRVGVEVAASARLRPGGIALLPVERSPDHNAGTRRRAAETEAYAAYLVRMGHPDEAPVARAEYDRGLLVEQIFAQIDIERGEDNLLSMQNQMRLAVLWGMATFLAGNILLLGVLWRGAVVLPGRSARQGEKSPHPRWAIVPYLYKTVTMGAMIGFAAFWGSGVTALLDDLTCLLRPFEEAHWSLLGVPGGAVLSAVLVSAIPLSLILFFAGRGLRRRASVPIAIVGGVSRCLPLIVALSVVWGLLVGAIAGREAQAGDAFAAMTHYEGRYFAAFSHKEYRDWPEPPVNIPVNK